MADWHRFYGGYNNSSAEFNNVLLIGDSSDTSAFNIPLAQAHAAGYGKGVSFSNNGYHVTITLDLVGASVTDGASYVNNSGAYVHNSGTYHWLFRIEVSSNGGSSYQTIHDARIFSHDWSLAKIYSTAGSTDSYGRTCPTNWQDMANASKGSISADIPSNTTHVRLSIRGESSTFPYEIVFPIEIVIPDFRPWAVRKSGTMKSLNVSSGFLRKRTGGSWTEVPKMKLSEANASGKGTSRIRKSGVWRGQSKIGS